MITIYTGDSLKVTQVFFLTVSPLRNVCGRLEPEHRPT